MKRVHTEAKKANRPQSQLAKYHGMNEFERKALFSPKEDSATTKKRGGVKTYSVYPYRGRRIGKRYGIE